MSYWAGLYKDEDRKILEEGVNTLLRIAIKLTSKKSPGNKPLLIQDEEDDEQKH
jgi:hypothetical protein